MQIKIEKGAQYIIDTLYDNGFEAFIVGGCVRDSLMGKMPKDWDIATNALPTDVQSIFDKTIPTGIKHGTVTVVHDDINYEVTTYRVDGEYLDMRRPREVTFSKNIIEDLSRRDFTINAMAYNDRVGLVDEFGGVHDISKKTIKCVGNPNKRFNEDALRIIRAVRFSSKLGFNIDEETLNSMKNNSNNIKQISFERINCEIEEIICSDVSFLNVFNALGISDYIFGSDRMVFENYNFNKLAIGDGFYELEYEMALKRAMLYERVKENQVLNSMKRLKYSKKDILSTVGIHKVLNEKYHAIDNLSSSVLNDEKNLLKDEKKLLKIELKNILRNTSNIKLAKFAIYSKFMKKKSNPCVCFSVFDDIIEKGECFSISQLDINGKLLIENGFKNGITIGIVLNRLLDYVIENPEFNSRDKLVLLSKNII
ncbi:tRNA nucleotidyltransferase (CCA-adding enzyme) [Peptostreptococcus sp. D1]|nr:tRNA nucleotidyltransferase (CCA-adding enzyme) [Peptostreptococcus sp. D1]